MSLNDDLCSRLELSFGCRKLKNMDVLSKSDPQIVMYMRDNPQTEWVEVGRTEMIKDNLNPKFVKSIIVTYYFEKNQQCKFLVLDIDNFATTNVSAQDLIGEHECPLANIVTYRGMYTQTLVMKQNPNERRGEIIIRSEQVSNVQADVTFNLSVSKLDKKDWFGSSDPFIVISRVTESGDYQEVHKTEMYPNKLNTTFRPFIITAQKLCNGDNHRMLRFECYDHNKSGRHELIGLCYTSLDALLQQPATLPLIEPNKQKKKNYQNSGFLHSTVHYQRTFSFLEYIRGGVEISLMVAIDFTASNGDPRSASSLHFRDPYQMNQYQSALYSISNILDYYDNKHVYPVFGFGAKVPPQYVVSHCFPCSIDPKYLYVNGVAGIMSAYQTAVSNVVLHGPTNFGQIINTASNFASSGGDMRYQVLLILTDGVISDMNETVREIVLSSSLPLSIIIVGVGNADFSNMDILDADDRPLTYGNLKMTRDIVQFVPYKQFIGKPIEKLAESVLAEVPEQLCQYMKFKGIVPRQREQLEIVI
ncbi:hypothetical protein AKO1_010951 [Acrasis kona]|uniref:C2 domain-containing protein n=1 Tax=Acrasis kona TaxID=1008807 RepID=A0AAW2YSS7_9EUKA